MMIDSMLQVLGSYHNGLACPPSVPPPPFPFSPTYYLIIGRGYLLLLGTSARRLARVPSLVNRRHPDLHASFITLDDATEASCVS